MNRELTDFQIFAKPAGYRCNLKCRYCYYLGKVEIFQDPSPRMGADLLETYIRQHISAQSGDTINFSWHGGEPTLLGLEYFQRIVSLQKKHCPSDKRITNGIQTNGTLLNDDWCLFFAENRFSVGLSLDGPQEIHDVYRRNRQGGGTHEAVLRGYECLIRHKVPVDILCVVNDYNVMYPLQVYRYFKYLGVKCLSFLPLVELRQGGSTPVVSDRTVHPEAFGAFLSTIFDEWAAVDIGAVKVQIFEEAARTAFGQEHSLCLFRPTCGNIPVVEYNGDVFACDHFVDLGWKVGNIREKALSELLISKPLHAFGADKRNTLPQQCRSCDVLDMCNGECPKNRFVAIAGETAKLNYLCPGYQLFFRHCRPFVQAVARQWRQSQEEKVSKKRKRSPAP